MTAALPLLSTAVATLGIALFGVFAWRTSGAGARSFARLCLALAAWTGALFIQRLFPDAVADELPWIASMALPPLAFAFAAHQGKWASRTLALVASVLWVPSILAAVFLVAQGEAVVAAAALYLYPALLGAVVVVALQESRGRLAGSEQKLRSIVVAGVVCLGAAVIDTLPWFGVEALRGWPRLAPLSSLLLVALLGTAIARHRLYQLRPLVGGAVTLAACAVGVAALLDQTVEHLGDDPTRRLLWVWFVILLFLVVQRPLLEFLRRPFVREVESRRREFLRVLDHVEGVLATSTDEDQVLRLAQELLESSSEIDSARFEMGEPRSGAADGVLESQGQHLGTLHLEWTEQRLARDDRTSRALQSFCTRTATALRALRLQAETRRRENLTRLGTMAAGIAHEIKNPLGAILGALDLLDGDALGEDGRRWIDIVREESRRMNRVVSDILTFGKGASIETAPIEVARLLTTLGDLVHEQAATAAVDVRLHADADLGAVILDADHVRHALLNLMLNALEVQKAGGGRIDVAASRHNGDFVVHVRDDGPGVPEHLQSHIFDPFFTTRSRGTGLGLAIAQQVAVAHGGSLRLEPPDQGYRGAHFVIRLPAGGDSKA